MSAIFFRQIPKKRSTSKKAINFRLGMMIGWILGVVFYAIWKLVTTYL